MIISHQHKFIFIRVPKTASTSVELALYPACGPQDIISGLHFHNDAGHEVEGYEGDRNLNHLKLSVVHQALRMITFQKPIDYKHASAKILREVVGKQVWNTYFRFCFVRNPFERIISLYHWQTKNWQKKHTEAIPTVNEYIASSPDERLTTWQRYTIDGKVAVDHVARYENIEEEFRKLTTQLGIGTLELPQAKSNIRKDHKPYQEVLDINARNKIEQVCRKEMAEFGYEW